MIAETYRISQVSEAVGVEAGTLRKWINRGQIKLEHPDQDGTWRDLTLRDVVSIALTAGLVKAGVSVGHILEIVALHHRYLLEPAFWITVQWGLDGLPEWRGSTGGPMPLRGLPFSLVIDIAAIRRELALLLAAPRGDET